MDWALFWTAAGVLVPLTCLIIGCFFKLGNQIASITTKLSKIEDDVSFIKTDIKSVDNRLSRLEGSFAERGLWEAKIYKKTKGE